MKPRLPLASMDENAMDADMDELLDLCTGKFTSQAEKALPKKSNKKENMEELLNLCSGKFTSQGKYPTKCMRLTTANCLKSVSLKRSPLFLGEKFTENRVKWILACRLNSLFSSRHLAPLLS